jgi:DNA repair protein RecN (Recombination protein N)
MLRVLRIRHLAVIQAVEVEFTPGLNVLTGETGAGKSMLVEAVGLLLGGRAAADLVRTGEAQAEVEATFVEPGGRERHIRREVTSGGRSRAFVDGAPLSAAGLRELTRRFVELHGQHAHQSLLDPATHLPALDAEAGLMPRLARTAEQWSRVRALQDQLDRLRMDAREKAARLDLIAFQLGEIEAVAPRQDEDEELAALERVLASADRVQRLCEESYALLYEGDTAVLPGLGGIWKRLGEVATLDPQVAPYLDARDSIKAQLEDLAFFLRRYADGIDASPARLQQVGDRLASIERLKRKYGPTLADVIARSAVLADERRLLSGAEGSAADLQQAFDRARDAYLTVARDLSSARRAAATRFTARLEQALADLAMPHARVEVRFNPTELPFDAWSERGIDQAEFFLSANPGEDPRPLARIASGGELSRVMLALRTPETGPGDGEARPAPTMVFDEVDAGIGGRVADVVGARLRALGDRGQVLCITHLPQIAARATTQFRIDKAIRGHRTVTSVERLDAGGRVEEIARMMAGGGVTDAVRQSARDLLSSAIPGGSRGSASGT